MVSAIKRNSARQPALQLTETGIGGLKALNYPLHWGHLVTRPRSWRDFSWRRISNNYLQQPVSALSPLPIQHSICSTFISAISYHIFLFLCTFSSPPLLPIMPVTTILLLRHGHRIAWILDPTTGIYGSNHPFPTRLPADPPLASHGVCQATETAVYLNDLLGDEVRDGRLRIYSSLWYRCLETLRPFMNALAEGNGGEVPQELTVRGERGVGEWFGRAWFAQPSPAPPRRLKKDFFPWIDDGYESRVVPEAHGEGIPGLHDRVASALGEVVRSVDREFEGMGRGREEVTVLICGHAAQIIAAGRALTGTWPVGGADEEDFGCFTCGVSTFKRRNAIGSAEAGEDVKWRINGGVAGGWDCVINSYCGHLSQGAERGWHFHGDESFDSYGPQRRRITADGGVSEKKVEDSNETTGVGVKL
jgi:transcription factor C subunit 7